MNRKEALTLRAGDVIEMDELPTHAEFGVLRAEVYDVLDRPGTNPLVRYRAFNPHDSSVESFHSFSDRSPATGCDASFISRIVERRPFHEVPRENQRTNIYAKRDWSTFARVGGELHAFSLFDLTVAVVQELPHLHIPAEFDRDRVRRRYERDQRPGFLWESKDYNGRWWHTAGVRRKAFRAWVLRNYRHFIVTRAELAQAHKEDEDERYAEYARDYARSQEREAQEDDDSVYESCYDYGRRDENLGLGDVLQR